MKMVGIRVSANIPEALSKPISDGPSPEEWGQIVDALYGWAGYTLEEAHFEESNKPGAVWLNVAVKVVYEMLPIFHALRIRHRKNKGGRPEKDGATGLFGRGNPHADLMLAVHRQQAKAGKAKGRVSVQEACRALTTKELPARYHNLTWGRLARLYYDGKQRDELLEKDIDMLKLGLDRALEFVQNATDHGPHLME